MKKITKLVSGIMLAAAVTSAQAADARDYVLNTASTGVLTSGHRYFDAY